MFKVNNKDTRTTSNDVSDVVLVSLLLTWTYFTRFSSVSIVNFERVNVCWEKHEIRRKKKTAFVEKVNHIKEGKSEFIPIFQHISKQYISKCIFKVYKSVKS